MKDEVSLDKAWRVSDLIDLEYFLRQETEEKSGIERDSAATADRRIYLEFAGSNTPPFSRRDLLKFWLTEKRKRENPPGGPSQLPGDMFTEAIGLMRMVIIITALLTGITLAWSVLSYRGAAPINIFTCLWVFIFPQVLMLAILCGVSVFRLLGLSSGKWGIYPLFAALLRRAAIGLKSAGENRLPGAHRHRTHAAFGMIGSHKTIYGSIFYRPVFILFQVFGVCFNIGLMGGTLFKIMITDLAFGWQTTLQAAAKSIHLIVGWISLPWSWLSSLFQAHPTLAQIEGSRIILKDGMAHLATRDLASWWPFLVMAILVYGLLPRVLLLAYGITTQARALKTMDFSHSACDRLVRRMQAPQMETGGVRLMDAGILQDAKYPRSDPLIGASSSSGLHVIAGVPGEIDTLCADDELSERLRLLMGPSVLHRFCFTMNPETDARVLQSLLSEIRVSGADTRILLLQEAWLPPIRETLSWIRDMRKAAGPQTGMIIGLVGKPVQSSLLTSPADADRIFWEQTVAGMGDPYIRVETLGG